MKKIFGVLIAVAMLALATLVLNGLVFRQVTWLAEENAFLRYELKQEIEAAKKENVTKTESAANGVIKQLLETQKTLLKELKEAETKNSAQIKSVGDELEKQIAETQVTLDMSIETAIKTAEKEMARIENRIFNPAQIYKDSVRSVVGVNGAGAGFLYLKPTLVATAFHVVDSPMGSNVTIYPNDGQDTIMGKVIKVWPERDLAIIELPTPLNAKPLIPADLTKIAVGDDVVVIGNPSGGAKNSLSTGIISGLLSEYREELGGLLQLRAIQTDASVYFGNSGGPMLNSNGEVLGIINSGTAEFNFNFAVPINFVEHLLKSVPEFRLQLKPPERG